VTVPVSSFKDVCTAWFTFIRIDYGFKRSGFESVYRRICETSTGTGVAARGEAPQIFAAVQRATAFYYRKRRDCLPKALTTLFLLRRAGHGAEICIGVRQFPFEAHAWVECGGEILDDYPPRTRAFQVLRRLDGHANPQSRGSLEQALA